MPQKVKTLSDLLAQQKAAKQKVISDAQIREAEERKEALGVRADIPDTAKKADIVLSAYKDFNEGMEELRKKFDTQMAALEAAEQEDKH